MSDDEDDIMIDRRWMGSGWRRVLPEQATALHMLVTTATDRDLDGSLDDLVAEFGDTWFGYFTGGLDCPVRWIAPADAGRRRAERKGREARRECVTAFHAARRPMPSTVRELATTMADLGILEVEASVPRWRSIHWPPLPDEVLPMSQRFREAEDWRRWSDLHDDTARHIAELLEASGPHGELILTSVEELEAATGRSDVAIRAGLEVLTRDEARRSACPTARSPTRSGSLRGRPSSLSSASTRSARRRLIGDQSPNQAPLRLAVRRPRSRELPAIDRHLPRSRSHRARREILGCLSPRPLRLFVEGM